MDKILLAGFITFFAVWTTIAFIPPVVLRRIMGQIHIVNALMHFGLIYIFFGNGEAIIQAELAAGFMTIWMFYRRKAFGWEVWNRAEKQWVRYAGMFTRHAM